MDLNNRFGAGLLVSITLTLAACGGGGGDNGNNNNNNGGGNTNRQPAANAGPDQSVDELSTVTLDGSGSSDADGDTLTYSWAQTAGTTVTLSDSTAQMPTFDAPDVTALNTPDVLTFELTVNDGTVSSPVSSVDITVNDVGLGANTPPMADAGEDRAVPELSMITLDASGSSDPDGSMLTYSWSQTGGTSVTLSDTTAEMPTFTSPDVPASTPETLTFELIVNDGTDTDTDTVDITVQESTTPVTVAGIVSYEFVNPNASCRGLNFNSIDVRPIRQATVQLLDDTGSVIDTTLAADDGSYSFSNVNPLIDVRIRVRAELKRSGAPNWDVEVRDNVDTSANPPPLAQRPLYVVDFPEFNTGIADIPDADYTATTGWGGSAYTGPRAAAPFAILDSVYTGMQLILTVDPTATFAPMDAFWSVNNTLSSETDVDAGELSSSFYSGGSDSLFLLGDAGSDTEEFDDHVVLHEWGHYFEDNFSRSDSFGGPHAIGETIDARLAFGEGWASALAAIALDEPVYCDTGAAGTSGGFGFNTETNNSGPQGFYNEMSVATLIYDLFDTNDQGGDPGSIGFEPIYNVMVNEQAETPAFTTLFSFGTELRANLSGADQVLLETLLTRENVDLAGLDIWGSNQTTVLATTPGGSPTRDILPLYTDLPADGTTTTICANSDFDNRRDGNNLSEHRYFRITLSGARVPYDVNIVADPVPPATSDPAPTPPDVINDRSNPDMFIWLDGGLVAFGNSEEDDTEEFTTQSLPANTYVANLWERRYADDDASSDFPAQICFDVTMSP